LIAAGLTVALVMTITGNDNNTMEYLSH
jgi:hypothetical protein